MIPWSFDVDVRGADVSPQGAASPLNPLDPALGPQYVFFVEPTPRGEDYASVQVGNGREACSGECAGNVSGQWA